MNINNNYFTIEYVAKWLKVSEITVRRWISAGNLKAVKMGKQWRISPDELKHIENFGIQVDAKYSFQNTRKFSMRRKSEGIRPWKNQTNCRQVCNTLENRIS
jgi:excisionase family DNA binding protein